MASIDTGGHGSRTANHEIPLIPFIDFLLCLVMFLLVTAVWNQSARIEASANVPGRVEPASPQEEQKVLHVHMRGEKEFLLKWKKGAVVLDSRSVPIVPQSKEGDLSYPLLAEQVRREWQSHGVYRKAHQTKFDRAVLHTDNSLSFAQLMAALDAMNSPERSYALPGMAALKVPAFQVSFAAD